MQAKKTKRITVENYLKYYYDIPHEGKTSAGRALRKLKNIQIQIVIFMLEIIKLHKEQVEIII